MSVETKNDFEGLVTRLGGDALFAMISGKKTWHDLVHGIAFGTARWAGETITDPIRKERDAALRVLEAVKTHLSPAFLPSNEADVHVCKYCGKGKRFTRGGLVESLGEACAPDCLWEKVNKALEAAKT